MATFLDELNNLQQNNFLGGIAKAGEAIKSQKENETLVGLWEKFKQEQTGLKTTDEQLGEFNKKYKGEVSRGSESPLYEQPKDVKMAFNFAKAVDNMKALTGIYQPYITAFLTLGDDGVKVANSLSKELALKLEQEELSGKVPMMELEYASAKQQYDFNTDKIGEWNRQLVQQKDLEKVYESIVQSPLFNAIPSGEQRVHSRGYLTEFSTKVNSLTHEMKVKYPNLSESSIGLAVSKALQTYDKSITYSELEPDRTGGGKGSIDPLFVSNALNAMKNMTTKFNDFWYGKTDEKLKSAFRVYSQTGQFPVTDEGKIDEGMKARVLDLYEDFKPGGAYDNAQDLVKYVYASSGQNWLALKPGGKARAMENGKVTEKSLPSLPTDEMRDIMRYDSPGSALKWKFTYNPHWTTEELIKRKNALDNFGKANTFGESKPLTIWDEIYNNTLGITVESFKESAGSYKDYVKEHEKK